MTRARTLADFRQAILTGTLGAGATPPSGYQLYAQSATSANILAQATDNNSVASHRVIAKTAGGATTEGRLLADNGGDIRIGSYSNNPVQRVSNGVVRDQIDGSGNYSSVIPGGSTLYPEFKCRAWVNFNGTGTVAIRASGNVSSITDNTTGDYTVNFTTAMPDANYAATAMCKQWVGADATTATVSSGASLSTSQLPVTIADDAGASRDTDIIMISVFR